MAGTECVAIHVLCSCMLKVRNTNEQNITPPNVSNPRPRGFWKLARSFRKPPRSFWKLPRSFQKLPRASGSIPEASVGFWNLLEASHKLPEAS
jgi:hypothetical protein